MKKIFLLLACIFAIGIAKADDLEAIVVNADEGAENGQINLVLNGGAAPFVYSWVGPDGFLSSDEDLMDLAPGVYVVTVSDNYCGIASLEVVVDEDEPNTATVSEDSILDIVLYPNPTSGLFYITSNLNVDVVVFNVIGKQLYSGQNVKQVDLSDHPAGIYMVQLNTAEGTVTRKITLQ